MLRRRFAWASCVALPASVLLSFAGTACADDIPSPDAEPRTDVVMIHTLAVMTTMRTAEAVIWPLPFADVDPFFWAQSYGAALGQAPKWDSSQRAFEWDGDPWPINVFGHALLGSELYFRARVCRHSIPGALLFATGASAMWEYMFEGNAVRPSGLDLWYTPMAGWVVGELRHAGWRTASRIGNAPLRGVMRFVLDPLGSIERAAGAPC